MELSTEAFAKGGDSDGIIGGAMLPSPTTIIVHLSDKG
jgi:hypothetical protein